MASHSKSGLHIRVLLAFLYGHSLISMWKMEEGRFWSLDSIAVLPGMWDDADGLNNNVSFPEIEYISIPHLFKF